MNRTAAILILIIALAFSAFYIFYYFNGYEDLSDGNDYAGLARSIVRGEGFSLGHVYPLALAFDERVPQPDNMWAPAYPVFLSIWFVIFGANDFAVGISTVASIWLLIIATYLLGSLIAGRAWGVIAALLAGLNQSVLKVALEGSPEVFTAASIALSIYFLYKGKSRRHLIISALLFGIAVLSRYQVLALAVPVWIFVFGGRAKRASLWCVVVIVTLLPWLIRNAIVLGNPFFTLQSYGEFTKGMGHLKYYYYTYRSLEPVTLWQAVSRFPYYMAKKFIAGNVYFALNTPAILNYFGILPIAYAVGRLSEFNESAKAFIKLTVVSFVIVAGLSAFDGHHWRHALNLEAFLAVSIVVGLKQLIGKPSFFSRRGISIGLIALTFFPARFPLQEMGLAAAAGKIQTEKANYEVVSAETGQGDIVISDASDAIWWYADRPSVWIPVKYSDLTGVLEMTGAEYIYLENTSVFISSLSNEQIADFYSRMMQIQGVPGGWGLFKRISSEEQVGISLTKSLPYAGDIEI